MDLWAGKAGVVFGLVASTLIRWPHAVRNIGVPVVRARRGPLEAFLILLLTAGVVVVPAVAVFTRALAFADYAPLPGQVWAGWVVMLAAMWLFGRSHTDLGTNWSPTLEVRQAHTLVTGGVYRRVRHPMYAAVWLWGVAQALLLPNWLADPAILWSFLPMYVLRVPREERMMLDTFGEAYAEYMGRTGRLLPRWAGTGSPRFPSHAAAMPGWSHFWIFACTFAQSSLARSRQKHS